MLSEGAVPQTDGFSAPRVGEAESGAAPERLGARCLPARWAAAAVRGWLRKAACDSSSPSAGSGDSVQVSVSTGSLSCAPRLGGTDDNRLGAPCYPRQRVPAGSARFRSPVAALCSASSADALRWKSFLQITVSQEAAIDITFSKCWWEEWLKRYVAAGSNYPWDRVFSR